MTSISSSQSDSTLEAAKKAALVSLLLTALATGISYVAYTGDLAASVWPWRVGLVVMLICSLAPFLVYFMAHRANALWTYGVIVAIAIFALYYFIFSPMSGLMRWAGLLGGGIDYLLVVHHAPKRQSYYREFGLPEACVY